MKRIIWDWNGTLLDDVDLSYSCINRLLEKNKLKPLESLESYRNVFGFPIESYYRKVGFDFSKTSFDQLAHQYMEDYQGKSYSCNLTVSAKETLKKAYDLGYDQTILSASRLDYLEKQVSKFDIQEYIKRVLGIQDIYAHSKISLAKQFVSKCNQEDEIWFIGDSIHDYEVAESVNAHCILVTSGHQSKQRLESCGVPVFENIKECLEYINERNNCNKK